MRFKKLRILNKYANQQRLAEKLNISRTAISMWESGKSYPTIPTIHKIAKLFNCSPETVFSSFEVKE